MFVNFQYFPARETIPETLYSLSRFHFYLQYLGELSLACYNQALFYEPTRDSMSDLDGHGLLGYTVQEDLTLLPTLDENGNMVNPGMICKQGLFCDICQRILSEAEALYNELASREYVRTQEEIATIPFYTSEAEIRLSIQKGCHLCALLIVAEKFRVEGASRPSISIPNGLRSWVTLDWIRAEGGFHLRHYRCDKLKSRRIGLFPFPNVDWPQESAEHLSASNASEETFQSASSWLNSCLDEHECQPNRLALPESPKRVLYVGDETDPQLRVVYPQAHILYLTVSHCWGNVTNLTLNNQTYNELTTGFHDQKLPRLWRDCVVVTRRLGFKYLWIDSLCICQDNAKDKAEEITKMGDIYSGSVCNIAAVSAPDSTASLFTKLVPLGTVDAFFKRKPLSTGSTFTIKSHQVRNQAPLYGRAWVVQERVLAPRTLEYTLQGIRCYCSKSVKRKTRNDYDPINLSSEWTQLLEIKSQQISESEKIQGEFLWMALVQEYTKSALTRETDREDALTGVITVLSKNTGLSFLHGVCKEFFPYSLLWRSWNPRDLTKNPPYPGASWSGTFHPGKQSCLFGFSPYRGTYKEFNSVACSVDDQTSIVSFKAKCSGSWVVKSDPCSDSLYTYKPLQIQKLDGSWTSYNRHEIFEKVYRHTFGVNIWMDYNGFDPIEVEFVLLLQMSRSSDCVASGLILTQIPDKDGLWRRLGQFDFTTPKHPEDIRDPLEYMLAPFRYEREFRVC